MESRHFKEKIWFKMQELQKIVKKPLIQATQPEGLAPQQAMLLITISKNQIQTVGDICKVFEIMQANASTMCKKLEKDGFINRTRDSGDERIVKLSITEKGRQSVERILKRLEVFDKMFDKMPPDERQKIIDVFDFISKEISNLEDIE